MPVANLRKNQAIIRSKTCWECLRSDTGAAVASPENPVTSCHHGRRDPGGTTWQTPPGRRTAVTDGLSGRYVRAGKRTRRKLSTTRVNTNAGDRPASYSDGNLPRADQGESQARSHRKPSAGVPGSGCGTIGLQRAGMEGPSTRLTQRQITFRRRGCPSRPRRPRQLPPRGQMPVDAERRSATRC